MIFRFEFWPTLVFTVVMLSWFAFGIGFMVRKKPPKAPESKRERSSITGIALQGAGYAIIWSLHRQAFTKIVPLSKPFEIALAIMTMGLAIGSVWFISAAVQTLGKQWSLAARLVEGHKLVTDGPYHVVRNP